MKFVRKHGENDLNSPEYRSWRKMKGRCLDTSNKSYNNYGGRGIEVCDRWLVFENFLQDMGRRPSAAHTLERKDNSRGYTPENCRWATPKEQARNRRNNKMILFQGQQRPLAVLIEELYPGEDPERAHSRISMRLKRGKPPADVFFDAHPNTPIAGVPASTTVT